MEPIPPEVLLDGIPPELARIGERMRRLVRAVLPDAVERVRNETVDRRQEALAIWTSAETRDSIARQLSRLSKRS